MTLIPVFSGGTGRSGTTIVINLLNRHENIHSSMPREIRFLTDKAGLLDLNYRRESDKSPSLVNLVQRPAMFLLQQSSLGRRQIFLSRMQNLWWSTKGKNGNPRGLVQGIEREKLHELLGIFKSDLKSNMEEAGTQLFFRLATAQISKPNVRYFVDSTPANIANAEYISRLLPGSRFINMVRDGRDVAFSVCKQPFGPSDPVQALDWWKNRMLQGVKGIQGIDSKLSIDMRLEDLIEFKREESYARLLNFLELPDSERMREYFAQNMTTEKMHSGSWKKEVIDVGGFERRYSEILEELLDQGIEIDKFY